MSTYSGASGNGGNGKMERKAETERLKSGSGRSGLRDYYTYVRSSLWLYDIVAMLFFIINYKIIENLDYGHYL